MSPLIRKINIWVDVLDVVIQLILYTFIRRKYTQLLLRTGLLQGRETIG